MQVENPEQHLKGNQGLTRLHPLQKLLQGYESKVDDVIAKEETNRLIVRATEKKRIEE